MPGCIGEFLCTGALMRKVVVALAAAAAAVFRLHECGACEHSFYTDCGAAGEIC